MLATQASNRTALMIFWFKWCKTDWCTEMNDIMFVKISEKEKDIDLIFIPLKYTNLAEHCMCMWGLWMRKYVFRAFNKEWVNEFMARIRVTLNKLFSQKLFVCSSTSISSGAQPVFSAFSLTNQKHISAHYIHEGVCAELVRSISETWLTPFVLLCWFYPTTPHLSSLILFYSPAVDHCSVKRAYEEIYNSKSH